jgi:hypothetical protein
MIHIGDDASGEKVSIPVFHTGVFGQTGVGKTSLLKYMLKQAKAEGYKAVIFDSKLTQPEFKGIGVDVPFYLQESTDPDVYKSLIEGMRTRGRGNMDRYRGGFIEICEPFDAPPAKDYEDIGRRLEAKLHDSRIRGGTRAMYSEIYHDHLKLMELLGSSKYVWDDIRNYIDKYDILRVPTRDLPNLNLQGLVVRSIVEALLPIGRRLIFLVDEAPNFVNQKQYNPAKSALQQLDGQGRSREIYGWYSGQTISGFDKANMKNLWYWILGREMERNEAETVFQTQTDKILTAEQIKKLKVREFIVATPEFTKLVTVPEISTPVLIEEAAVALPDEDWSDVEEKISELEVKLSANM